MKQALEDQLQECKKELDIIDALITGAPLEKSAQYLKMYALIKSCGTVECVFKSIVADYFSKSTISQIQTFIDKTIRESSASPTYGNICKLLKNFDDQWAKDFKQSIECHTNKNKFLDSINSLVTNRHQFAHGNNSLVSFNDILQYYCDSVEVLRILDSVVK